MDVGYINAFIKATREVIATMVHVPLSFSKPRLREVDERTFKLFKVSAIIALSGPVNGQVVLTLSEDVAIALASGLSGEKLTAVNNDCLDALAEIVNMIAGAAKKELSTDAVCLTIPRLARTQDVHHGDGVPVIVLPCDTPNGRFLLEISLRDAKRAAVARTAPASKPKNAAA